MQKNDGELVYSQQQAARITTVDKNGRHKSNNRGHIYGNIKAEHGILGDESRMATRTVAAHCSERVKGRHKLLCDPRRTPVEIWRADGMAR